MDYAEWWRAYDAGHWEPDTREWVNLVVRPGDLFVDVGAWIGPVSLWALAAGAYVVAIEPDPVACAELRHALSHEIESGWAEVHEVAIVAVPGEEAWLAPNPQPGSEWGDSMSGIAPELATSRLVPSCTLPELLASRTPSVVKIDVEGYETRLAKTLLPWLAERGAYVQISLHGHPLAIRSGAWLTKRWTPSEAWGDWRLYPR